MHSASFKMYYSFSAHGIKGAWDPPPLKNEKKERKEKELTSGTALMSAVP